MADPVPASKEFWEDAWTRRAHMHVDDGYRDGLLPQDEGSGWVGANAVAMERAIMAVRDAFEYVEEEGISFEHAFLRSTAAEIRMALEVGLMLGREESATPPPEGPTDPPTRDDLFHDG